MNKIKEIERLQAELDKRNEIEEQAIELITNCQFEKAIDLLKSLNGLEGEE